MIKNTVANAAPGGRTGRPRRSDVDATVLRATRELLATRGYAGTSLDDIATQAAVAKTTIYRRWSSKASLVIAALRDHMDQIPPTPDNRPRDLRDVINWVTTEITDPGIHAGLTGLFAEAARDPALRTLVADQLRAPYRDRLVDSFHVTPSTAERMLDVILGSALQHVATADQPTKQSLEDLIDMVIHGLDQQRRRR